MDIVGLFKYFFLFFNFLLIYYLKQIKAKENEAKKNQNSQKSILIITAHPDDESMFFIPSIINFQNLGYQVKVLCLSNGNSERRIEEFQKACKYLNLTEYKILDLKEKGIIDKIDLFWNQEILFEEINKYLNENTINGIVSFDQYGVSQHPNHISIYQTLKKYQKKEKLENISIYTLKSINIMRKYFIMIQLIIMIVRDFSKILIESFTSKKFNEEFVYFNFDLKKNWNAMKCHQGEFVWFRKLFVIFSSYTYINELVKMNNQQIKISDYV